MAAEVSSMVHGVNRYKKEVDGKRSPVTIDLLSGGMMLAETGEVDVELEVEADWDRSFDHLKNGTDLVLGELHDLNLPPPFSGPEKSSSLDLCLSSSSYLSVCTLEKVKSALERAERESRWTSSSTKRRAAEGQGMAAAGCPCCLLYVLICMADPRCPRCDALVPLPPLKKPRIDLNSSSLPFL